MAVVTPSMEKAAEVVEWARETFDMTNDQVAGALGTTGRTIQRWRSFEVAPAPENEQRLEELDELRFWVRTVFGDDYKTADEWLRTRLVDLRGKTPLHLVFTGRIRKVIDLLVTYHTGAFI